MKPTKRQLLITMAELNVRSVKDELLEEWTNHRIAEVRDIARAELDRRFDARQGRRQP